MKWLEFWAMLQSIGTIIGAVISLMIIIIYIVLIIKDKD